MRAENDTNEKIANLLLQSSTAPEAATDALWRRDPDRPYPKPVTAPFYEYSSIPSRRDIILATEHLLGVFMIHMGLEPGTSRLAFKRSTFWSRIDTEWQKIYYFRCTRRNPARLHADGDSCVGIFVERLSDYFLQKILVHSYLSLLRSADRRADGFLREIYVVLNRFPEQAVRAHTALIIQRGPIKCMSESHSASAMLNELTPYTSWSLSFKWARPDRPPSKEWMQLWGTSNFSNAVVVVTESCLPHLLSPAEEAAFQRITTILRNPFTKLSLPPLLWNAMRDPVTAVDSTHWMDEKSVYDGSVDAAGFFHGPGTWTFGRWQYAGQFAEGVPQGLGAITERQYITGLVKTVYEGEVYGGTEHGFGRKTFFDSDGTTVLLTLQGKWIAGQLANGNQSLYPHHQQHQMYPPYP